MEQNPLWEYSISVYRKPGVESLLLQLQESIGADVNIVLCLSWLALQGKEIDSAALTSLIAISAHCQDECILELRSLRRRLKVLEGADAVYKGMKALELEAERWQQDLIWGQLNSFNLKMSPIDQIELAVRHCETYCNRLPNVNWGEISADVRELIISLSQEGLP